MKTLLARHKPRRGMVGLMVVGSLMVHGSFVGIASLWTPPPPEKGTVVIDIGDVSMDTPGPGKIFELPLQNPPESPVSTATPDVLNPVATPPPVSEEPNLAEPSEQTPLPRRPTIVRSTASNRPTSNQAAPRTAAGPSSVGLPGVGTAPATTGYWVMPHPPYPRMSVKLTATGQTTVRITTDATGQISNVVIVKSTGNAVLDNHTLSYVRNNWHGPANASRTTEFVYELR